MVSQFVIGHNCETGCGARAGKCTSGTVHDKLRMRHLRSTSLHPAKEGSRLRLPNFDAVWHINCAVPRGIISYTSHLDGFIRIANNGAIHTEYQCTSVGRVNAVNFLGCGRPLGFAQSPIATGIKGLHRSRIIHRPRGTQPHCRQCSQYSQCSYSRIIHNCVVVYRNSIPKKPPQLTKTLSVHGCLKTPHY